MDENETVDRVLAAVETVAVAEPAVPEQVPVPAGPKRTYTKRADGAKVRVQVAGYLTCLNADESLSVGELAVLLGESPVVVGYHCRALLAAGKISATGEKRGRRYAAIKS
jgi:DNA-binding transcriptional ArsR family regulator